MTNPNSRYNWDMFRWFLISMIAPAVFAIFVALVLLQKTSLTFEIALPMLVGVGAIGAAIHYRTYQRPPRFRLMAQGGYALVLLFGSFVLWQSFSIPHDRLLTCPVCGFHTLYGEGDLCKVCNVEVSEDAAALEDYASVKEYIQAEQMMYFLPEKVGEKVDFFAPYPGKEGYRKDPDWKPIVSEQDVLEVQGMSRK